MRAVLYSTSMIFVEHAQRISMAEAAALLSSHDALQRDHRALQHDYAALKADFARALKRIDWLQQHLFGSKSERRIVEDGTYQMNFGADFEHVPEETIPETRTVPAHERKVSRKNPLDGAVCDTGLRFGPQVPVEEIRVAPREIEGLAPDAYEIIDEKVTHKLAQLAGSYVVLKYIQPVIKRKDSGAILSAPAPAAVLEKSYADVSFLAAALIDKFVYHQPLYRQHQKLEHNGIVLARGTLTSATQRAIGLLEPIYDALFASVLNSLILAMDETPTKAGRAGPGKMKTGYFWPIYGDQDEVVFPFFDNRRHENVATLLKGFKGTLLTDGYAAYDRYAAQQKILDDPPDPQDPRFVHAHCWVHLRRMFLAAEQEHPDKARQALEFIRTLYRHEEDSREKKHEATAKRAYRQHHSAPVVHAFFAWLTQQQQDDTLLPRDAFTAAMNYALTHRDSFEVFLDQPELALDTNHLERTLRVIPMGRKNWNFCWTELGAKQVGIIQSLLVSCKLHGVNPYDYLVDVLQRVGQHPASRVHELTPRLWKQHFAANPLRSALYWARNPQR